MTKKRGQGSSHLTAVDLFCGGGGFSTGLALACEDLDREARLVAVNHWTKAIQTHERNHEWAEHYNAKVEELHPPDVVGDDDVDLLVAGPECTHFSTARGGKPVSEQKRASPWHVVDWVQKTRPEAVLVENVPELQSWGPIDEDGQPTRNGETFDAWTNAIHSLGYSVDWDVLNAADYGDATTRRRLFVVARRTRKATHPDPTHTSDGVGETEEWRSAAEVIDWSDHGESIWQRSRPLVQNTMERIAEGIRRHCHDDFQPFADAIEDLTKSDVETMQAEVVPGPLAGVAAEERERPFFVEGPALAPPEAHDEGTRGLCLPYLLRQQSGGVPPSVEEPVPTIAGRGAISKLEPEAFVLPRNLPARGLHSNGTYDPEARPLHTVTAKNHDGHLVRPSLMQFSHGGSLRDLEAPLPTITTAKGGVFAISEPEPFLIEYYGNGGSQSIEEPLPTVTTRDRFALVLPDHYPWGLDVRFRMLQPRELAAAQGFPEGYEFAGNKTETTEQIGNAVPVNLAKALVKKVLTGEERSLNSYWTDTEVPADD